MDTTNPLFTSLDSDGSGVLLPADIAAAVAKAGISINDKRLGNLATQLDVLEADAPIDPETFESLVTGTGSLLERAVKGDLIIPEFSRFEAEIRDIFTQVASNSNGEVASYIPQLDRIPTETFAVSICTIDGQRLSLGECDKTFTVQSSCKPVLYCAALEEHGEAVVHSHVGREPSGLSFNELTLNKSGLPHNPMINAGAIMCGSLLKRDLPTAARLEYLTDTVAALCGNEAPGFNNAVFHSERETADRNFALAHHMRERGAFPENTEIRSTLDYYFSACSLELDPVRMSSLGATLANGGVCPLTGERVFQEETVKNCLSMMYACGMYDYSGEFAFTVGIPAKSSVSGVILAVIPNVMSIVVWSPRLDACGNSVRGIEFFQRLVDAFNFHNYDNLVESRKIDPRRVRQATATNATLQAIYAASIGDVSELRRLVAHGHDLDSADYDGRTPLHLAAAEGQVEAVGYLLNQGVSIGPLDRWGNTPVDDAIRHDQGDIVAILDQKAGRTAYRDEVRAA